MATGYSPRIVTDGLVLALDAGNTKSFRGEPTTNVVANPIPTSSWNVDNFGGSTATRTFLTENGASFMRISDVINASDYPRLTDSVFANSATITGTFSTSLEVRGTTGAQIRLRIYENGSTKITNTITLTNEWVRYKFENQSTEFALNQPYFNPVTTGATYDIRNIQIEAKSYATPFVNGTRGATVATGGGWVDRSGNSNHGELVNGPTYNSSNLGSLVFDGVDDWITIPFNASAMDFSLAQTIIMWLKPGTGSNSARRNPYNQAYGGSGTITHEPGLNFNYFFGTHGGNNTPYVGIGSSFNVSPNELAFIAVTRSQPLNICRWYKNGVRTVNTSAGGYASTNNGSSPILIANGYTNRFIGDIYYTFVYNRFFTDDEILQTYNATKGRFGL